MSFLAAILTRLGIKGIAIIAAILVVAAMAWRYEHIKSSRDALESEVTVLEAKLVTANAAVKQAGVVNQAMRDAIVRQNGLIDEARAQAVQLEAAARTARAVVAKQQAASRELDVKRRARLDAPSAAEMNAVLRSVVGAM